MLAKGDLEPDIEDLADKIVAAQGLEVGQLQIMLETPGETTSAECGGREGMTTGKRPQELEAPRPPRCTWHR